MFTHPTEPEVNIQAQIHPYTQTGRFNRKTDKTFPRKTMSDDQLTNLEIRIYSI